MSSDPIELPAAVLSAYIVLLGLGVGTVLEFPRAVLVVWTVLGWLAITLALSGRPQVWVALGRRRLFAILMLAPFLPLVGASIALEYEWFARPFAAGDWLFALTVTGLGVWYTGTTRYATEAAGTALVSWSASLDSVGRGRLTAVARLGVLATVGGFVAVFQYRIPSVLLALITSVTVTAWFQRTRVRTYEACEHGLRYSESSAAAAQLSPWTRFDGYRETDGAVVLERRFGVDVRMDAADVPAAARETLAASIAG